ncbi:MAG: PilX N-terminal domain-containing pilus assembly protein [Rhodanobacteraceae bacterium]
MASTFSIRRSNQPARVTRQRGVVLLVALVFLIALTILALAVSGSSLLQEKMVGGFRNTQLATFGAESALRAAEARLWESSTSPAPMAACGTAGLFQCYSYNPLTPIANVENFRNSPGFVIAGAVQYSTTDLTTLGGSDATAKLASNPYYIIEDLGIERPPGTPPLHESGVTGPNGSGGKGFEKHLFRITARSQGGNANVVRVLESTFAAKAN